MTRAKRRLFLSRALLRRVQGVLLPSLPSRFLREVPAELVEPLAPFPDPYLAREETLTEYGSSALRAARQSRRATHRPVEPRPRPASTEPCPDGYAVGVRVTHPRFGRGRILLREGHGAHLKLTIDFTRHGPKKILPAYTRLALDAP
jgi:DNA helicase-2/ATP-dependent DNA helicase PcrA